MLRAAALLPYPYDTTGSQRYRLEQWQRPLVDLGVDLQLHHLIHDDVTLQAIQRSPLRPRAVVSLLHASARRTARVLAGPAPDVWVLHREATMVGPALIERLAARRAPVIFDVDDAIWLTAGERPSLRERVRRPWKTDDILRLCAGVAAGNQYLADHAAAIAPNVHVVPTTIDVRGAYARQKRVDPARPYTVGWSGSAPTSLYIRALLPALAEAARHTPFRLLVIGAQGLSHPDLEVECRPWRSATEVDDLLEMDVGLMPLPEDRFARGKCGCKALQYMGLGIPAVISPVGVNAEIVTEGENGFFATTDRDWHRALAALSDPELRVRLGAAARATVEERYSAETGAAKLAALLRRVRRAD